VVYPVAVSVPAGTAAGTYGLQGVAYSADSDPGESSVTSKRVGITVAPPPPKQGIPPWVWIVVALLIPDRVHARVQGMVTLIGSIILIIVASLRVGGSK
jgi:hypothetical protein